MIISNMQESILVENEVTEGVPVCAANMSSPVIDVAQFIDEIHYNIGNRTYIENAPHV